MLGPFSLIVSSQGFDLGHKPGDGLPGRISRGGLLPAMTGMDEQTSFLEPGEPGKVAGFDSVDTVIWIVGNSFGDDGLAEPGKVTGFDGRNTKSDFRYTGVYQMPISSIGN